jgi:imidazoleglycerol-phosphate dehydratase/histidinol-phosphatase
MSHKKIFVSRDGALLEASTAPGQDVPTRWVGEAIPALWLLRQSGYGLILVDSAAIAREPGTVLPPIEGKLSAECLKLCASQGAEFEAVLSCIHDPIKGCDCAPDAVRLADVLSSPFDRGLSRLVSGSRQLQPRLASVLGVREQHVGDPQSAATWPIIARAIINEPRTATVARTTRETRIQIELNLDVSGDARISTGLGFFDHMLEQLGKHGGFLLTIRCAGDQHVDEHHTIEDVALALGEALRKALGDKLGIQRYGFLLPMDESSAEIAIDLGGRPYLVFDGQFQRDRVGDLPTELVPHFFRSLADTLGAAIQIRVRGDNAHHMIEACFKGFARALRQAIAREGHELPTTKGML